MNSKTFKSIRNFILLILIAWFVKTTILEIYVVPTGSMLDTIEERDLVIGNKFIYGLRTPNWIGVPFSRIGSYIPNTRLPEFKSVQNGDITVFEFPYDDMHKYVKRTIGLPKQFIEIKGGKISIGDTKDSIIYRQDLTYPEKSRIKKERTSLIEDPRPTEKAFSTFQHNKFSEIFSYYNPISDSLGNAKYIDRDNISFQVPFKGMKIDFNDENIDLYSNLMILLLDGYNISLKGDSIGDLGSIYNLDEKRLDYNSLEPSKNYQFHKFDNEQMFDTSMTIWGFVKSMNTYIVLAIIGFIVWKIFSLFKEMSNREGSRFNLNNSSQLILYLSLLSFIIYLSNVDTDLMLKNRSKNIINTVNNDIENGKISLKDFFTYNVEKQRKIFSNSVYKNLNEDYLKKKNDLNTKLNTIISEYWRITNPNIGEIPPPKIDFEVIHSMDISTLGEQLKKLEEILEKEELSEEEEDLRKKVIGLYSHYKLLEEIFHTKELSKDLSKDVVELAIDLRKDVMELAIDFYNYKNLYDYNVSLEINKILKKELLGKILINGTALSEKSDYILRHDYYFMVGDNRNGSSDSRSWGFVPDYNLLGQPVMTVLNFGKFKLKFDVHL